MRMLFNLAGLLIVLAVILWLARTQLTTVMPTATPATPGAPAPTVPEQSRQMQQQVKQGIERALEQGAGRASDSQP